MACEARRKEVLALDALSADHHCPSKKPSALVTADSVVHAKEKPGSKAVQQPHQQEPQADVPAGSKPVTQPASGQPGRHAYELLEFWSLPEHLKDNEFIHRHYRGEWPVREALYSLFRIHNETGNIWT